MNFGKCQTWRAKPRTSKSQATGQLDFWRQTRSVRESELSEMKEGLDGRRISRCGKLATSWLFFTWEESISTRSETRATKILEFEPTKMSPNWVLVATNEERELTWSGFPVILKRIICFILKSCRERKHEGKNFKMWNLNYYLLIELPGHRPPRLPPF